MKGEAVPDSVICVNSIASRQVILMQIRPANSLTLLLLILLACWLCIGPKDWRIRPGISSTVCKIVSFAVCEIVRANLNGVELPGVNGMNFYNTRTVRMFRYINLALVSYYI